MSKTTQEIQQSKSRSKREKQQVSEMPQRASKAEHYKPSQSAADSTSHIAAHVPLSSLKVAIEVGNAEGALGLAAELL